MSPTSERITTEINPERKLYFGPCLCLRWIGIDLWDDISFMSQVVHCLVAEKNSDALWHRLQLDDELGPKISGLSQHRHGSKDYCWTWS